MLRIVTPIVALLLQLAVTASATTYYVRTDGNDGATGTSDAAAWTSVEQVRAYAWDPGFAAGDSILYKGGETFATSQGMYFQTDKLSGTGAPLYVGSYGTGRATIAADSCDAIMVWAPSGAAAYPGLVVRSLDFIGNDAVKPDLSTAHGVIVWNSSAADILQLHVEDCDFSHFCDGLATGRDDRNAGRLRNVVIRNVVSHDNPGSALISPHSGSGIVVAGADGALIEHCIAYNNGENNNNSGGPIGIWYWDCINSTIQYCESYDNKTVNGDGGGFDLDGACSNCVVQYCYSHGNAGAGYLLAQFSGAAAYGPLENNTIRCNISENDGRKGNFAGIYFWGASATDYVGTTHVYNNTVYMGGTPDAGAPACVKFNGSRMDDIHIRNNIFVAADSRQLVNAATAFDTSKVQFQGNCWWNVSGTTFSIKWGTTTHASLTAWQGTGQEMLQGAAAGMQADPLLTDPGTGITVGNTALLDSLNAYRLQSGSPAIDAGLNLATLFGTDPGSTDYFGTSLPQEGGFDIGAGEWENDVPVELTSFTAAPAGDSVVLQWSTATEDRNMGFNVLAGDASGGVYEKVNTVLIPGYGTTAAPQTYSFVCTDVAPGTWYYKLEQVDSSGIRTLYGPIAATVDAVSGVAVVPGSGATDPGIPAGAYFTVRGALVHGVPVLPGVYLHYDGTALRKIVITD